MKLDRDLEAIQKKLDAMREEESDKPFSSEERHILREALGRSQQARVGSNGASTPASDSAAGNSHFRRELDFFLVCVGYTLIGFAVLVTLRWSSEAPLGAAGEFGLAYLAGLSATALLAWYTGVWTPQRAGMALIAAAGLCFIGSFIGLMVSGAIGAVLGIVFGAIFFQTLMRRQHLSHEPTPHAAG